MSDDGRLLVVDPKELVGLARDVLGRGGVFRFRAHGSSMWPFIHSGDLLEVTPADLEDLRVGEVAVYDAGRVIVVHRVVGRRHGRDGSILTIRGDATSGPGDRVMADQILGRVESVVRASRTLAVSRGRLRLAAMVWQRTRPLGAYVLALLGKKPVRIDRSP